MNNFLYFRVSAAEIRCPPLIVSTGPEWNQFRFSTPVQCVCVGVCVRFDSSLWFQVCKTNQLQQKLEDDTYSLDVPIVQKKQRNAERYNSLRKNPPEPKVSVRFWLARMIEERIYIPGFVQIPFIPIFPISPISFLSIDPFNFHLCLA